MKNIKSLIIEFLNKLFQDKYEVYNEISLEHELGIHLREKLPYDYKVQFERPVEFFDLDKSDFVKREIDISIFGTNRSPSHAIELKYPRAGQHPEQMFKSCQDIKFLEQLVESGFSKSYFLFLTEDHLFYKGSKTNGIYSHFRAGKPISGIIKKPTGTQNINIHLNGSYVIKWNKVGSRKYSLVEVG